MRSIYDLMIKLAFNFKEYCFSPYIWYCSVHKLNEWIRKRVYICIIYTQYYLSVVHNLNCVTCISSSINHQVGCQNFVRTEVVDNVFSTFNRVDYNHLLIVGSHRVEIQNVWVDAGVLYTQKLFVSFLLVQNYFDVDGMKNYYPYFDFSYIYV